MRKNPLGFVKIAEYWVLIILNLRRCGSILTIRMMMTHSLVSRRRESQLAIHSHLSVIRQVLLRRKKQLEWLQKMKRKMTKSKNQVLYFQKEMNSHLYSIKARRKKASPRTQKYLAVGKGCSKIQPNLCYTNIQKVQWKKQKWYLLTSKKKKRPNSQSKIQEHLTLLRNHWLSSSILMNSAPKRLLP